MKISGAFSKFILYAAGAVSLVLIATSKVSSDETISKSEIAGIWRGDWHEPSIHGQLQIVGSKSPGRATISGMAAPVQRNNGAITFALPNNLGEFRGRIVDKKIVGHWIQPASKIYNNRYATPVELNQTGKEVWRGEIQPLEMDATFWLSIQSAADRSLFGIIRNPEFNFFRRNNYRVESRDSTLSFSDTKNPDNRFETQFDRSREMLSMPLPDFDKPIQFKRVSPDRAVGFYARTSREQKYVHQKPNTEKDGWAVAALSDVDLDPKPIAELINKIIAADPANNPLNIHSLLIARHGKLALEEYFYGSKSDEPHTMRSASKTFAPLLLGIAHEKGAEININTPVYSQFPGYKEFANPDPRKGKIMMRTHRATKM
jgi:hypothetical protein